MNDPLRDPCFGNPFGRLLMAGNGEHAAVSTPAVELETESSTGTSYEFEWVKSPGERENISNRKKGRSMNSKALHRIGAAACIFGSIVVAGLVTKGLIPAATAGMIDTALVAAASWLKTH